ncbi:MAG TPA: tRNA pseudouridine(55) synthase TruB [Pyrinomonadaceae bacterium]|nr:tRNA pseudouridine(55) synthase TruB [Pyrinomonadaceae bacterium]
MFLMDGVLIIDKPVGFTSHDVVARVRKLLHVRRVGHTGTLDPFATGVLVVLVGRATRLAQFVSGTEKEYEAIVRLGYATDTGDITGAPVSNTQGSTNLVTPNQWSDQEIEAALESLVGEIDQIPPMYSAKKVGGRKLYDLARRGERVERQPARVIIHTFQAVRREARLLKDNMDGTFDLAVHVVCSAGTYIRALAESLGERLNVGAHLAELRRIRAGAFPISEALSLESVKAAADEESLATVLLPPREALRHMPFAAVSASDARSIRQGRTISLGEHSGGIPAEGEDVAIRDETGDLIAVGCYHSPSQTLKPRVVLAMKETATDEHK